VHADLTFHPLTPPSVYKKSSYLVKTLWLLLVDISPKIDLLAVETSKPTAEVVYNVSVSLVQIFTLVLLSLVWREGSTVLYYMSSYSAGILIIEILIDCKQELGNKKNLWYILRMLRD
jgi:hypothetical protein